MAPGLGLCNQVCWPDRVPSTVSNIQDPQDLRTPYAVHSVSEVFDWAIVDGCLSKRDGCIRCIETINISLEIMSIRYKAS